MQIQSITYSDQEETTLSVVTADGTMSVPWPCHTWHREAIQEWLDAGNTIAAYVPPPVVRRLTKIQLIERLTEAEIDQIYSFLGGAGRQKLRERWKFEEAINPDNAQVRKFFTDLFGATRAEEILA